MIKWIKETGQKYIAQVLIALTFSFAGLVRELYVSYVKTPREIKEAWAIQHKEDSTRAAQYMEATNDKISGIESSLGNNNELDANQTEELKQIKTKLKIK